MCSAQETKKKKSKGASTRALSALNVKKRGCKKEKDAENPDKWVPESCAGHMDIIGH